MILPLRIPGAWMWSSWQPDRAMPFNSYLFQGAQDEGALVAVDPLPLDDEAADWIDARGGLRTIIVTNRDHERAVAQLQERFGARVIRDATDGQELVPRAFAVDLPGGKAPEFAVVLRDERAAIIGDSLIGSPAGSLSLLPDEKLPDRERLLFALRRLWGLQLDALLLCDGQPIFAQADRALGALIEARLGARANCVNVDELRFESYKAHARFAAEDGEVGLLIGARKLGYRVAKIPPGKSFCPLHWHAREEEFFYVLDGAPSIRTGRGTIACRAGDFIAFPTGERGMHELRNDSDAVCTVLLVGATKAIEVCHYPDSAKVLFDTLEEGGLMVRSTPALDYFDGE